MMGVSEKFSLKEENKTKPTEQGVERLVKMRSSAFSHQMAKQPSEETFESLSELSCGYS